jgi:serine/threonine protein kinase
MADVALVDAWLDRWEDTSNRDDPGSLDRFVAEHCTGAPQDCIDEFRAKAVDLQRIDYELLPALIPRWVEGQSDLGSEDIDLKVGAEPVAGYRLVSRLGSGGFGEVWKAHAPGGFPVALKLVRLDNGRGTDEQEALKVLKELEHPSLVTIFSAWCGEKWFVVAMELAQKTLHHRVKEAETAGQPGIPFQELISYMSSVADGIDFLHDLRHLNGQPIAGIQHGDIKPVNLLLARGRVKIADFGLLRVMRRTQTGHAGAMTSNYAPPEFLKGQSARNSDQYSLAVTYCELRGGRLPFDGHPAQIVQGHLNDPPDLSMIPEDERPAVARALAKDPHQRWPCCMEFVRAVEEKLGDAATVYNSSAPTVRDKRLEIERWAQDFMDKTATKLTEAWPALADDLRKKVGELSVYQLSKGPGEDFREKVIGPAVEAWHQQHIQPLLDEASRQLRDIAQADLDRLAREQIDAPTGSTVEALDVVRAMMVPGGVLVGGGAVAAGIVTTVKLLVFTTVVVHWPVLVTGLVVGAVISWFGVADLMGLRQRLQTRFENKLLPAIHEALIGEGVEHKGQKIPSLRQQLQQQVRETTDRLVETGR